MRKWIGLLFCLPVMWGTVNAQSYIRGQVLDQSNQPLLGVEIFQPSTQQFFHTGSSGTFGFPCPYGADSVVFTLEGYGPVRIKLTGSKFSTVTMRLLPGAAQARRPKLLSLVGQQSYDQRRSLWAGGETYANQVENEPIPADQYPATGFALNIDKASYSNARRFINLQMRVPPDAAIRN